MGSWIYISEMLCVVCVDFVVVVIVVILRQVKD